MDASSSLSFFSMELHIYIYIYIYICVYVHGSIRPIVYIYIYIYICVCIKVYVYSYTYMCRQEFQNISFACTENVNFSLKDLLCFSMRFLSIFFWWLAPLPKGCFPREASLLWMHAEARIRLCARLFRLHAGACRVLPVS
ncbi:putative transmembrane protein [Toxoplasma gondii GAB2-2007-GAL-DOM2]|uniref:Putative transmembrane protein n=1 Tax=Toxoplasma gondii GAB2-2007-GAL-DOM2 TaxID=1130820 RepID=A0A086KLP9_TOXGO|nr:putative transmembrane protein [Toxoplasma gondii GAB2-2007-GAL-DOM2]